MTHLEAFLKQAGWRRTEKAWLGKSRQHFSVHEEEAPGAWDRSAAPFLAKAILQARAQTQPNTEAVAALKVKRASPLTDSRLAEFVDSVAPNQSWILLDGEGRVFPHVPSAPELTQAAARQVVAPVASVTATKQQSLFTDLNQWMLKVLLAPNLPEHLLSAPRGRTPRNASGLAELAKASLPAATRLLHALEADGQLETRFGDLRVSRPLELLTNWRDRMGHPARQELAAVEVRGQFDLPSLLNVGRVQADATSRHAPFVLGLHAAATGLGFAHVTGATPVVWAESLDSVRLQEFGLVAVDGEQRADVVLRTPRYPESLFRGVVCPAGSPTTDIIQCWLDTSHYRIRGQEQADFIWRRVFKSAFKE